MFFNDCKYPTATETNHSPDIKQCVEMCQIYGDWDKSCSFSKYNGVDPINCQVYANTTLEDFIKSCNLVGLPILDSDGICFSEQMTCDELDDECTGCTPCLAENCGGYIQTECGNIGHGAGALNTFESVNMNSCMKTCKDIKRGSFVTFNREEKRCDCYENGYKECLNEVITYETDFQHCSDYHN